MVALVVVPALGIAVVARLITRPGITVETLVLTPPAASPAPILKEKAPGKHETEPSSNGETEAPTSLAGENSPQSLETDAAGDVTSETNVPTQAPPESSAGTDTPPVEVGVLTPAAPDLAAPTLALPYVPSAGEWPHTTFFGVIAHETNGGTARLVRYAPVREGTLPRLLVAFLGQQTAFVECDLADGRVLPHRSWLLERVGQPADRYATRLRLDQPVATDPASASRAPFEYIVPEDQCGADERLVMAAAVGALQPVSQDLQGSDGLMRDWVPNGPSALLSSAPLLDAVEGAQSDEVVVVADNAAVAFSVAPTAGVPIEGSEFSMQRAVDGYAPKRISIEGLLPSPPSVYIAQSECAHNKAVFPSTDRLINRGNPAMLSALNCNGSQLTLTRNLVADRSLIQVVSIDYSAHMASRYPPRTDAEREEVFLLHNPQYAPERVVTELPDRMCGELSDALFFDFTDDGLCDVFVERRHKGGETQQFLYVGNGDGTFGTSDGSGIRYPREITGLGLYNRIVAIDVDADGSYELLGCRGFLDRSAKETLPWPKLTMYRLDRNGTATTLRSSFAPFAYAQCDRWLTSGASTDMNADGWPDFAALVTPPKNKGLAPATVGHLEVLLSDTSGGGLSYRLSSSATGGSPAALMFIDLLNDGSRDIVVLNDTGSLQSLAVFLGGDAERVAARVADWGRRRASDAEYAAARLVGRAQAREALEETRALARESIAAAIKEAEYAATQTFIPPSEEAGRTMTTRAALLRTPQASLPPVEQARLRAECCELLSHRQELLREYKEAHLTLYGFKRSPVTYDKFYPKGLSRMETDSYAMINKRYGSLVSETAFSKRTLYPLPLDALRPYCDGTLAVDSLTVVRLSEAKQWVQRFRDSCAATRQAQSDGLAHKRKNWERYCRSIDANSEQRLDLERAEAQMQRVKQTVLEEEASLESKTEALRAQSRGVLGQLPSIVRDFAMCGRVTMVCCTQPPAYLEFVSQGRLGGDVEVWNACSKLFKDVLANGKPRPFNWQPFKELALFVGSNQTANADACEIIETSLKSIDEMRNQAAAVAEASSKFLAIVSKQWKARAKEVLGREWPVEWPEDFRAELEAARTSP